MPKGFFEDDEDEDFEPRIVPRPLGADEDKDELAASAIAPYAFGTTDAFDTRAYVASLFKTPLFGVPLRDGTQNHPVPPVDSSRPRSWKLPGTNIALPTMPGVGTALDDGRRTILGDDTAAGARLGEPDSEKPAPPPPPVAIPPLRSAADAPDAPSIAPAPGLDPSVEAIATATGINRHLVGAAIGLAKTWFGNLVRGNSGTRPLDDARPEAVQHKDATPAPAQGDGTDDQTESKARQRRDSMRTKIDAEADRLDRDYDPKQRLGRRSRIKRAFVLLKHVDDPMFDDLAREFEYDPERLRAIARLSAAKSGDYDTLMEELYQALADENGRVTDHAFWILYGSQVRGLIGGGRLPAKAAPSDDRRTAAILELLEHDLSSRVRGDLTRDVDVLRPLLPQMAERALERPRTPQAGVALGITRKQHGGGKNAPHKSDAQYEQHRQARNEAERELQEAYRTQASAKVKKELEKRIKHHQRKMQETGESHSQRHKGPDNKGRGGR